MLIRLGGLFFLVSLVFWLWALFDSLTSDASRVRNLPKLLWVAVVLLLFEVGGLAWVIFGRPRAGQPDRNAAGGRSNPFGGRGEFGNLGRRGPGTIGSGWPVPPRKGGQNRPPVGPDDDPDFLRGLK
ncbi:MAG TPA: PLDc N-terminal domain-containing protein [Jatrophihabitans sp.]|nr:PLDc N-terminal domain-containing protein [Jatrophihabitans sp.]